MIIRLFLLFSILSTLSFANNTWENTLPKADKFDWIQTTSGEWLKGEIKGMYDRELEFDSDEFGIQTIDWEDVKQLISRSLTSLNVEKRGILVGQLYVHNSVIVLSTDEENIELQKEQVISLTNGANEENSYWSGKLSLGITLSSGNTDRTEFTAMFDTKRQTAKSRFQVNYIGNYSKTNKIETENNQRLSSSIDIFQTRRFFWRPAFVEYYQDTFQNIEGKYTYGAGAGYDIYASKRTHWTIFAGPAYQSTTFDNVPDTDDKTVTTPAFILTSDYDIELTKSIDFIIKYQAYFVDKDSGSYVQHALASLETELINDFDLDLSFIWDRVEDPARNSDGSLPDKDDYKSILSVAYSF